MTGTSAKPVPRPPSAGMALEVTQTKSVISEPEAMRKVLDGLGLRRIGDQRVHQDNNCIRGMINKVAHLVSYRWLPAAAPRGIGNGKTIS